MEILKVFEKWGSLPDIKLGGVNGYPAHQTAQQRARRPVHQPVEDPVKYPTQQPAGHPVKQSPFVHTTKQTLSKPEISYTSDVEDYRPTSAPFLKSPVLSSPGLTYSDVAVSSPYDDDQSASTSDSQSSVIHVSDSRRASVASNASTLSSASNQRHPGAAVNGSRDVNKMNYSPCPSPQPQTTVWSPSGKSSVKTYKPVHFSTGSGSRSGLSQGTSSQKSGINVLQRNISWDSQGPSLGFSDSLQNTEPSAGYQSDSQTVSRSQTFEHSPGYTGRLSHISSPASHAGLHSSSVTSSSSPGDLHSSGGVKSVKFINQNSAQNEDNFGAKPEVEGAQSSTARWTPTLTSKTTLSVNTEKDEVDDITHSSSLPNNLSSKQEIDPNISATEYHNGGVMWNNVNSQPGMWSPTEANDLAFKQGHRHTDRDTDIWVPTRQPVTIETKSVKANETSSSLSSPPWRSLTSHLTTASATSTTTTTTTSQSQPDSRPHSQWNGTISHFSESVSGMPQTQSSTITLLQKGRERRRTKELQKAEMPLVNGHAQDDKKDFTPPQGARTIRVQECDVPAGAILVGSKEVIDGEQKHTDTYYMLPGEKRTETRTTVKEAPKYEGIGPVDHRTGMPVGFRSGVDEKNQKDWYKKMYKSLHKTADDSKDPLPVSVNDKAEKNTYKPTYVFPEDKTESQKEEPNPYRPAYELPSQSKQEKDEVFSSSLDRNSDRYRSLPVRGSKSTWTPAHARYREDKYKNQPRSIEDYEPGKSSIALKEQRLQQLYNPPIEKPGQFSKYYESDTEVDIRRKDRSVSPSPSDVSSHDIYKAVQKGADIPQSGFRFPIPTKKDGNNNRPTPTPNASFLEAYRAGLVGSLPRRRTPARRHVSAVECLNLKSPPPQGKVFIDLIRERSYSTPSSHSAPSASRQYSDTSLSPRQRRDEDNARRRQQLEKYTEEQRQKKYEQTLRDIESRKHHDIYIQKSPIQLDRFGDFDSTAEGLRRPEKKVHTETRGKARARYNFTAQNKKELSFRKGDTVYLLKQIDKNWYEGERHGIRGIFPLNYVEVLTSLAEAQATAEEREGEARAKYNFTAQTGLELSLKKGDIVTLIRRVDANWYEGKIGERQGIFPASYVETCKEPETPLMTPLPSLAPTPVPGSPGQLSPGSSIAPTIPTAPHSPRDLDSFDFDTPFDFAFPSPTTSSNSLAALSSAYNLTHGYPRQFSTHNTPSAAPSYGDNRYGSLDRGIAGMSSQPVTAGTSHSVPATPYGMSKSLSSASVGANANALQDQLDYVTKSSTLDRQNFARDPYNFERPRTTPPALNGGVLSGPDRGRVDHYSPYAGLTKEDFYPTDLRKGGDRQNTGAKQTQEARYPMYKAIYTYKPQNADELELREGDVISVMEKCDDGWYVGTCLATNHFGTFPGNYVQPV